MQTFSAAQAISPAIEMTKQFLFKPFRVGRFLKLTLVAALTEAAATGFNGSFPSGNTGGAKMPPNMPKIPWPSLSHVHWPSVALMVGISALVILIVIPIGILLSYLLIRLRFSFFDCLLRRQDRIGVAWGLYHRQAVRYLGLSLGLGLFSWIGLAAIVYWIYQKFKPLLDSIFSDNKPAFTDFLPLLGVATPAFMMFFLVIALADAMMSNFVLPRMALEDASIGDAVSDVWTDLKDEPVQFLLFLFLKFLLSFVGSIIGAIGLAVPLIFVVGLFVVLVLVLKAASTAVALAICIPVGIVVLLGVLAAIIGVNGTLGTFRRSYALLFYGGRFPALGNILQPPPPQWTAPFSAPAPEFP